MQAMKTGYSGTFVISWSQTEVDGLSAAPMQTVTVGATWAWRGDALRVDGPPGVLRLAAANGSDAMRRKAARMVQRLVGAALDYTPVEQLEEALKDESPLVDSGFVVTDGTKSYTVTVIEVDRGAKPLLMFLDDIPPRDTELWIVHHTLNTATQEDGDDSAGGVICFTPGTRIDTPDGPRLIEELREGDRVQTRDNGAQTIEWMGSRRMSGARLFAMPRMRPVRIATGALGVKRPDQELLVSPQHRMLVRGDIAKDLFNTSEVLVAAKDLVNGTTITVDLKSRQITYIHLLLPRHEVIWANGVETESFHPASAALSTLRENDRDRLLVHLPQLQADPHSYGGYARRNLQASEAAILRHAA